MKQQLEKLKGILEGTVYELLMHEYSYLNIKNEHGNKESEEIENPDVSLT
ncbi:hypothetical protein [Evansella clarkii]|nr:hypothetical protein [Evansella clarkii]